jgi:hypothetical protein
LARDLQGLELNAVLGCQSVPLSKGSHPALLDELYSPRADESNVPVLTALEPAAAASGNMHSPAAPLREHNPAVTAQAPADNGFRPFFKKHLIDAAIFLIVLVIVTFMLTWA